MSTKDIYSEKPWLKFYPKGVPANIKYEEICLHDVLERTISKYGQQDALIFQGFRITYNDLATWSTDWHIFSIQKELKKGM